MHHEKSGMRPKPELDDSHYVAWFKDPNVIAAYPVVCAADVPLLVERFTRRARSGERHPGHADASALDELIPRIVNQRWDALDLDGPVIHVDTTRDSADVHQLIRDIRHLIDEHASD
jgi:hypothetical protein